MLFVVLNFCLGFMDMVLEVLELELLCVGDGGFFVCGVEV